MGTHLRHMPPSSTAHLTVALDPPPVYCCTATGASRALCLFLSSSLLAASVLSGTTTQQVCKCWQLQQAHTTPEHTHGILLMSFLPLSSLTFRSPSPPFTQHATHASAASSQRFLLLQAGFIHCFLCVFRWACFSLCGNVHLCVCVCTHTHLRRVEVCETQRQSCPLLPRSYCCPTEMTRRLIRERERETER